MAPVFKHEIEIMRGSLLYDLNTEFDVRGTVHRYCILLSIANKMQYYTIFFITVNAVHVSGGFSTHHQELKTVHTESGKCQTCLLLPLAS
jgi:hypothetical protein